MVAVCLLIAGCTSAVQRSDPIAARLGLAKSIVDGAPFRHVIYRNGRTTPAGVLHVYLEGDGVPFVERERIAKDPTSANPLMLELMATDPAPAIDLGRPCYFGLARDAGCNSIFWTMRRYGPEVLASMTAVLQSEAANRGASRLELFGHSGGGTLAVLLAQRMNAVTRVVTIGANLDIDAWCRLHHYTLLSGSLNPAVTVARREGLSVIHLVGAKDDNTPPWLVAAAARERGGEPVRVIRRFDHNCCWDSIWSAVLADPLRVGSPAAEPPGSPPGAL